MTEKNEKQSVRPVNAEVTPFVDPETGKLFEPPKDAELLVMDENGRFVPVKKEK